MLRKSVFTLLVMAIGVISSFGLVRAYDAELAERLHGYILLQVEEHGEAWFIRSSDSLRYYMEDGDAAYTMMRYFSLGITDEDLESIPSVEDTSEMLSAESVCDSNDLASRLAGEILLQVEQNGEAWYVYPGTCRMIYMADGDEAYTIMRYLGLGITNGDLELIEEGVLAVNEYKDYSISIYPDYSELETEDGYKPFIPYGNGRGVQVTSSAIVTLQTMEAGQVSAIQHGLEEEEVTQESVTVADGSGMAFSAASLSEVNDTLLAVWLSPSGITTGFSVDGGMQWGDEEVLTERPTGPSVPSSCLWQDDEGELRGMVAWVDPPTSEDGGPLYVAEYEGGAWGDAVQVGESELISSPSLACFSDHQSMVFRQDGDSGLHVHFTQRRDGEWEDPEEILLGADPHMAECGDDIWVGYHWNGARRGHSSDGGDTWTYETVDNSGKFGSIACEGNIVAYQWGDYASREAANTKDSTQRTVGVELSFDGGESWESWEPAEGEMEQSIASVDVYDSEVIIFWRSPDSIRIKRYSGN